MSFAQLFPRRSFLDGNIMQKEDNGSSYKIKVAKKNGDLAMIPNRIEIYLIAKRAL